jgi:hypothetical protein
LYQANFHKIFTLIVPSACNVFPMNIQMFHSLSLGLCSDVTNSFLYLDSPGPQRKQESLLLQLLCSHK